MNITPIPAFKDNYIWYMDDGKSAWVVDPGDAGPVLSMLQAQQLELAGILVTHHHPDHVGGLHALLKHRQVPVVGPANSRVSQITLRVKEGDEVMVLDTPLTVIEVPGHTLDHIAFYGATLSPPVLFCGDTLFSAGCGRLFEGTPAQMFASLAKLCSLPPQTLLYCTHEYTQANLKFAAAVLGDRPAVTNRITQCEALRATGKPTLPVTLSAELTYNPFLMTTDPQIEHSVKAYTGVDSIQGPDIFAALRRWKDAF
jgi:hydroxyacylglutathione hydrolase